MNVEGKMQMSRRSHTSVAKKQRQDFELSTKSLLATAEYGTSIGNT